MGGEQAVDCGAHALKRPETEALIHQVDVDGSASGWTAFAHDVETSLTSFFQFCLLQTELHVKSEHGNGKALAHCWKYRLMQFWPHHVPRYQDPESFTMQA